MPAKFSDAPEVREIAEELIEEHSDRLPLLLPDESEWIVRNDLPVPPPPVVLVYLFRDDVPKSQGQEVWGTAKKISGRDWFLAKKHLRQLGFPDPKPDPGAGFRIEMSQPVWDRLEDEEKRALTFHELRHCRAERGFEQIDTGKGLLTIPTLKLYTVAHDLEVFDDEEQLFPGWRHNLRRFEDLVRRNSGQALQGSLDLDPAAVDEDAENRDYVKRLVLQAVRQVHGEDVAAQAAVLLGLRGAARKAA